MPSPACVGSETSAVRALLLKMCLLSHLALLGSGRQDVAARIYRNDDNHCTGDPLRGNDPVYTNSWYMALLRDSTEPNYREENAPVGTPGGGRRTWATTRTWAAEDTMDGPQ